MAGDTACTPMQVHAKTAFYVLLQAKGLQGIEDGNSK